MKKLISICLTFVLLAIGITSFASDYDNNPRIPKLSFLESATIPTVNAGDTLTLDLTLRNTSTNSASSIVITPSLNDIPLVYERPIIVTLERSLRGGKDIGVNFSFKVSDNAKSGVYAIPFKIQYNNIRDEAFTTEQNIYFKVDKENIPPIITVNNVKTSIDVIGPNSDFKFYFDINNIGDLNAKDMRVSLTSLSKDEFIVSDSNDLKYVGTVNAKSSYTACFDLRASKSITGGTHAITVSVSYTDSYGEKTSVEKTLYLTNVSSTNVADDGTASGTPKVMISSYSTNPKSIKAGDNLVFAFNFTNTNNSKTIKNMKITVNSEDGAFMIAKGSNTFYIETMGPKSTLSKSIELNVKQDLTSKSYPINISFDYEDSNGTNYTSNEVINLPVTEYSKLVINGVYVSEAYVGGNTNLSFDYINMGKATVSNLTASVEGDYTSVQSINYIGNLNAGSSDYYDLEVSPTKEGENNGVLVLSFEDSSGKIIEVRKEFQGYGMAQNIPGGDDYPIDPTPVTPVEPAKEPVSMWIIIGSSIGALLVSFIITKIIATKIFTKKLEKEI